MSASRRILIFSAVVNRRLRAFDETSVGFTIRFIIVHSSTTLDTDLWGGRCLSYVGREGSLAPRHFTVFTGGGRCSCRVVRVVVVRRAEQLSGLKY